MRRARSRYGKTIYHKELEVVVDRPAARFAAWYEMFPAPPEPIPPAAPPSPRRRSAL